MKIKMHTVYFSFLSLLFSILFPLFVSQGDAESTAEQEQLFIANMVKAYGGKEQLAKVRGISAEGLITSSTDGKGSYYRYMQPDGKLYVHIRYSDSSEKRILNGTNGYRGFDGRIRKVIGAPYDAMVYQYNQLDLPFGLMNGTFRILEHRQDKLNGVNVEVLKLADKHGYEIEVYISARNYHILKVVGYFTIGQKKASLGVEFMDYRKVKGILLAHKAINYAMDSRISETQIAQYTINPKIDTSIFNP